MESAKEASAKGTLRQWVIDFMLEAEGGNSKLATGLQENDMIVYAGPLKANLSKLKRITGSNEENLMYTDTKWEENISAMVNAIKRGWSPPPLVVSDWFEPEGSLSDGNHRCEALIRAGYDKYWAIFLQNRGSDAFIGPLTT